MPNNITTTYGKAVVDTSLVPYIREREVEFVAHNLKPYKVAKMFFDDVVVNNFCQAGNRLLLDSKKIVELSSNNQSATIVPNDVVYQGTSATVNTFNGIVETYYSANSTIIIRRLDGDFDDSAQLYVQNALTTITYANCNVISVTNYQTSDSFYAGEGVISPTRGNYYSTVMTTSGENILYLKQNYINANVTAVSPYSLSTMANDYKDGDIVYQTATGAATYSDATFRGIARYFNTVGAGAIAIEPISGSFAASGNAASKIWNASNTAAKPLSADTYNNLGFASNTVIRSVLNTSVSINISSFVHRSGVIANTEGLTSSSNVIRLATFSGINPTLGLEGTPNGNLIYFTSGTGVGAVGQVIGFSANANTGQGTLQLVDPLGFVPSSNTRYSIGNFQVDQHGTVAGLFEIPSFSTFKFKTGNRVFTITDTNRYNDPDYEMRAAAIYAASGMLNTSQRIQMTPVVRPVPEVDADSLVVPANPSDRPAVGMSTKSPVTGSTASTTPRIPLGDGLAQTFFVPKPNSNKQDYGIFCTSIDLFFKSKPSVAKFFKNSKLISRGSLQLPVTVKIAEVVNGFPTKNYLATKTLQAKDVNVSDLPNVADASTVTKFTFDDPVYLEPNREYAIIIGSDSPDYEVYIAELGADVLGAVPTRRISEQPYAGSFFRSQNSSTWTPYQNEDLMFVVNKAVFTNSGTVTMNLDLPPVANIDIDRVMLTTSELKFPVGLLDYKLKGVYAADSTLETSGIYLTPLSAIEYGSILDKSNKNSTNRRRLIQGNANSMIMTLEMSSSDEDISPIVNMERLSVSAVTFAINNAGLSNTKIAITNFGSGYTNTAPTGNIIIGSSNASMNAFAEVYRNAYYPSPTYNVGMYALTITGNEGSGAQGFAVANTDGSNTVNHVVLYTMGSGYVTTPTVSFATGLAVSNVQARALISGETGKSGGNILSKYITREIILEDGFESGDLRVFMDAIRPTGTNVLVYYKVLSADDPETISDKSWRLMSIAKDVYSKNPKTYVGLEFRPSLDSNQIAYTENGINYPIGGKFKNFQIKVCMTTSDQSLIPRVKNLRISAVPEG